MSNTHCKRSREILIYFHCLFEIESPEARRYSVLISTSVTNDALSVLKKNSGTN